MRIQWMFLSCLVLTLVGCSEPRVWLEDRASLLGEEQARSLDNYHRYLLEDHDIDYRMVIESGDDDINQRAVTLFRSMEVGQRSDRGRGLLLLLNPEQSRVRIEVSQSLEGVYPDALVSYLERQQMVPFFQRGRVADGILATTELVITRAQEAEQNQEYYASDSPSHAAGAGAVTDAELDSGAPRLADAGGPDVAAGNQPRDTVTAYLHAMAAHDDRPDLSIYTGNTQDMLAQWAVTPGQMDNLVRLYRACGDGQQLLSSDGGFAVIRYGIEQRQCAPWFLRHEGDRWRLDLAVQQQAVGFGRSNAWRMNQRVIHRYKFAFMDWRMDGNGYPQAELKLRWGLTTTTTGQGLFVTAVQPGSASERFGFHWGDRVVSWNGERLRDHRHALQLMQQAEAGAHQAVVIERKEGKSTLEGPAPAPPAG